MVETVAGFYSGIDSELAGLRTTRGWLADTVRNRTVSCFNFVQNTPLATKRIRSREEDVAVNLSLRSGFYKLRIAGMQVRRLRKVAGGDNCI